MKFTFIRLLLLFIGGATAFATTLLPADPVAGQDQIEFGAVYDCGSGLRKFKVISCEGNDDFDYCQVQTANPTAPGGFSSPDKMYRRMIKTMLAEGCKIKDRSKQTNKESGADKTGTTPDAGTETADSGKDLKFKPGDRVMASPGMDGKYEPCTVISVLKPNSYGLLCDPNKGKDFRETAAREDFVRAGDGSVAPQIECPVDVPPGTVTRTAPASAALFKRIIYEKEATSHQPYKVGMKFETFQMGLAYKNVVRGRKLLHEGLPPGVTIYPIKTRFVRCIQARPEDSYSTREVWESCYGCAKDKFGEWTCGSGTACGANGLVEQKKVPNLSYYFKKQ